MEVYPAIVVARETQVGRAAPVVEAEAERVWEAEIGEGCSQRILEPCWGDNPAAAADCEADVWLELAEADFAL